jgi:ferrous iron transport protein B
VKRVLLVGNPNVGKSVVFTRLTGAEVVSSNYPGTTVDYTSGRMLLGEERAEVVDVPGTYSLEPSNPAEAVAVEMLDQEATLVSVVDATNLERNLYLTLQLLERGGPLVVALNMWDEAHHLGIEIDPARLEALLGVPVVPTVALTGEGISELVKRVPQAPVPAAAPATRSEDDRWAEVGRIVREVQQVRHRHHTLWDRFQDATVKPLTGIPAALLILAGAFGVVRAIGEGLTRLVMDPLFELYRPLVMWLAKALGPGLVRDLLVGAVTHGKVDFLQAMGLLTTGLYAPFAVVLPYVVAFYLVLSLLEDTGYLPRLAALTDAVFHGLGMHGHAIVPVLLGFGCNVPGVLATRVLETRRQRFIAATLIAMAVPCLAQSVIVFGVLGRYGLRYVAIVYGTLALVYLSAGILLNRIVGGESPELFAEIPRYRKPAWRTTWRKTLLRTKSYVADAVPWMLGGVALVNVLYATGAMHWLARLAAPVVEGLWGLPGSAVVALLMGVMRKYVAVGMLLPLGMTPAQLTVAVTVLSVYLPCAATFAVLIKELGLRDTAKALALMVVVSVLVGGLLRVVLMGV